VSHDDPAASPARDVDVDVAASGVDDASRGGCRSPGAAGSDRRTRRAAWARLSPTRCLHRQAVLRVRVVAYDARTST
jgi:hypothetical protein